MLRNEFRGLICNAYFKNSGGVECFNFIAGIYFDNFSFLGGMNMKEEYLRINWDRGHISYSDMVPVSAILEQGFRRATDEELSIERAIKKINDEIKTHEKEIRDAIKSAKACTKQYKRGATFAIYDLIACNDHLKYMQYELDALKRVKKILEEFEQC
ncbi:hypothetical protein AB9M75_08145 [Lactobacillus sp. AN1001]